MILVLRAGAMALAIAAAAAAGPARAQAQAPAPAPPPPLSAAENAALAHAAHRGDLIYLLDQAAWVSTDAMLKVAPDPHAALGVIGWVISPKDDGLQVTYYRQQGDHPAAAFVAQVTKGQVVASHVVPAADDIPLTPFEHLMIQARTVAAREQVRSCTAAHMNAVVLPPDSQGGPWPVYLLSAQVKTGEYPFGGHFEVDVADDGKVVGRRSFTNSCLNMGQPPTPPAGQPAFVVVTHLLDATPTEIHVYLSHWMKLPVVVLSPTALPAAAGQPHRTWLVDRDHISLMRVDP